MPLRQSLAKSQGSPCPSDGVKKAWFYLLRFLRRCPWQRLWIGATRLDENALPNREEGDCRNDCAATGREAWTRRIPWAFFDSVFLAPSHLTWEVLSALPATLPCSRSPRCSYWRAQLRPPNTSQLLISLASGDQLYLLVGIIIVHELRRRLCVAARKTRWLLRYSVNASFGASIHPVCFWDLALYCWDHLPRLFVLRPLVFRISRDNVTLDFV